MSKLTSIDGKLAFLIGGRSKFCLDRIGLAVWLLHKMSQLFRPLCLVTILRAIDHLVWRCVTIKVSTAKKTFDTSAIE